MLAKKTSENQLTLPEGLLEDFRDVEYFDVSVREGKILLTPVDTTTDGAGLRAIRDKMEALGIADGDVNEAVQWARKKKQ